MQLVVSPPDPTWREASCWPGASTTYVVWDVSDADATIPAEVRTTIAAALDDLGIVVFLGGSGCSTSNIWQRVDGGWTGVANRLLDWLLRRPSLRLMATRNVGIKAADRLT
jgi:hypothetical protein